METITIVFYDCEHNGDLDDHKTDIRRSGGRIIGSRIDYDNEVGYVEVEINESFMEKFSTTSACQSSNLDN